MIGGLNTLDLLVNGKVNCEWSVESTALTRSLYPGSGITGIANAHATEKLYNGFSVALFFCWILICVATPGLLKATSKFVKNICCKCGLAEG
jgi:hypothetical protein